MLQFLLVFLEIFLHLQSILLYFLLLFFPLRAFEIFLYVRRTFLVLLIFPGWTVEIFLHRQRIFPDQLLLFFPCVTLKILLHGGSTFLYFFLLLPPFFTIEKFSYRRNGIFYFINRRHWRYWWCFWFYRGGRRHRWNWHLLSSIGSQW